MNSVKCPMYSRITIQRDVLSQLLRYAVQATGYVVADHSSRSGQAAAMESGLSVAALTQCLVPHHLQTPEGEHLLEPRELALYRSRFSEDSSAIDSLYELLLRTLGSSITSAPRSKRTFHFHLLLL